MIKKYYNLIKQFVKMDFRRMSYYKTNYFFTFITNILIIIIKIAFWDIIFQNKYQVPGWNFSELIVFIGFSELFFAIKNGFFASSTKFWLLIVSGKLDVFLVRPINPKIRVLLANMNIMEFIKGSILFMSLLVLSKSDISLDKLIFGIFLCFISAIILSLLEFVIGYLAFKFGRVEAVIEIIDSLTQFNKYPLNMFPKVIYIFFVTIIPFAFFSTIPALISVKTTSYIQVAVYFLIIVVALVCWLILDNFLWKKGLKKYESYNG